MGFREEIESYTAEEIIAVLGCRRGTAYDWKQGRREPPEWQQKTWLEVLKRDVPKWRKKVK